MPVTFIKMKSFIGSFQDFFLNLMQILIVFNTFKKPIVKNTPLLLKNTFKSYLFRKGLST